MSLAAERDRIGGASDRSRTPKGIQALPVELLQAIFLTVVNAPDPCWASIETATYNETRAHTPYRISGVCHHWRRVAFGIADLWTYVALPPRCGSSRDLWWNTARASLRNHLDRSGSRGLSIVIIPNEAGGRSSLQETGNAHSNDLPVAQESDKQQRWFQHMLSILADEADRWVRIKILFPPHTEGRAFSQFMASCGLPRLRELSLAAAHDFGELETPWLSDAPVLHELCVDGIDFYPPESELKTVRRATYAIRENHAHSELWKTLSHLPALRSLTMQLECDVDPPAAPVALHELEVLTVRGESQGHVERVVAADIVAPSLRLLRVECTSQRLTQRWGRHHGAAFPTITDLEVVRAELRYSNAEALGALAQVRRVSFVDCVFPLEGVLCAQNDLFSRLDRVWPALGSLAIVGLPESDAALSDRNRPYGDETLQRLAFFIRAHQRLQLSLSNRPTPFPQWFRRVVGMLLGPDRVYLSTSDGAVYSVLPDGGGDEPLDDDDEAEFTDSDTPSTSSSETDAEEVGDTLGRWKGRTVNGPDWESDSDDREYLDEDSNSEP